MDPIQSLAFVVNTNKVGAEALAESLARMAENYGIVTRNTTAYPLPDKFLVDVDACCVIGGDGTLLGVVEEAARRQVPVLGVNLGMLGFMATFSAAEAQAKFTNLLKGDYPVVSRTLLNCRNARGQSALALNDIVIKNYATCLFRLDVFSNHQEVNNYYCDGLIFSTPTGSTAYNLSAGGPIIHPAAKVIAMTPICPHTLSNRSVIFDQQTHLRVLLHKIDHAVHVSIDGHSKLDDPTTFPLEISIAAQTFPLIQHRDYSHFQLVRSKLRWRDGAED